ncbi:MAG: ribokinase [Clostridium sp.]
MKVCILGSINMDEVVGCQEMPKVGETILADTFKKVPGGKGANQAVAAKRMGCDVYMIGKIGNDSNGEVLLNALKKDEINTEYIFVDKERSTGVAVIFVDSHGSNSIAVVAGANMGITYEDLEKAKSAIKDSKMLISQFETPVEITIEAFKYAKSVGVTTLLNPAPARDIPDELLQYTDIIVPNESEAESLTGIKVVDIQTAKNAANNFLNKGAKYVIITLGDKGAAIVTNDCLIQVPANKVNAVDTTAAGDSFIGGLTRVLSREESLDMDILTRAVRFANKVSAIVVTREGAQTSIPSFDEVINTYGEE